MGGGAAPWQPRPEEEARGSGAAILAGGAGGGQPVSFSSRWILAPRPRLAGGGGRGSLRGAFSNAPRDSEPRGSGEARPPGSLRRETPPAAL